MTKRDIRDLLRHQDRDPRLRAKSEHLMMLLNINIANIAEEIESGESPRKIVRALTDDVLVSICACLRKLTPHLEPQMPFAAILTRLYTVAMQEAVRRNVAVPEYLVVLDDGSDLSEDDARKLGVLDGLGVINLTDMLFLHVTKTTCEIMDRVLSGRVSPADAVAPLPTLKIENAAIFFDLCFEMIAAGELAQFAGFGLGEFHDEMQAVLAACCAELTQREAEIPAHIPHSRRGPAPTVNPGAAQFQA